MNPAISAINMDVAIIGGGIGYALGSTQRLRTKVGANVMTRDPGVPCVI